MSTTAATTTMKMMMEESREWTPRAAPRRDGDVKKADEYWWGWHGMSPTRLRVTTVQILREVWWLMTTTTTVIQNGDLSLLPVSGTAFSVFSQSLHIIFIFFFFFLASGGRMVSLHTFPSSSKIWLAAASLLLGSSLQLRSVHPTAFLLTFRLASDAVLSCCFHYDFRMTFFGTHIFIYSDIFCCCFLNFYPIL